MRLATCKSVVSHTLIGLSFGWLLSCSGGEKVTNPVAKPRVSRVTVLPSSVILVEGEVKALMALPADAGGVFVPDRAITWSTKDAAVAIVDASGIVTAMREGYTSIVATADGVTGAASVVIHRPAVASVSVAASPNPLVVGLTTQAEVITRDAKNVILTGRSVTWGSSDPGVASVDGSGVVTALKVGTTAITANIEGVVGGLTLSVIQPAVARLTLNPTSGTLIVGSSGQIAVGVQDANGNTLLNRTVVWVSSKPAVASVSATGLVTGVSPGATTVTATSEGVSATASVSVVAASAAVATVTLQPSAAVLNTGDAGYYLTTLKDAAGNILTGRAISWTSSNPSIASVDNAGLVSGLSAGTATITAASEGKTGSATVTVSTRPPPVGAGAVDLCTLIAGGKVIANDGQFLGSLTNQYNSQSILNPYGSFGSKYSPTSIWNDYGIYGGSYSPQSPFNRYALTPPKLFIPGFATPVLLTVNATSFVGSLTLNPYYLKTCANFP